MVETTDVTGEELLALIDEEKKHLKKDRIYLILEAAEQGQESFSMFCLDTTKNNKDGSANTCQIVAKGLTGLLSTDIENLYELGKILMAKEESIDSNVVSLDSFRENQYKERLFEKQKEEEIRTITFSFENSEDGDDEDA
tara:strand:+ start:79 stop:498 length:420 start_codon:yes stop_codon:yes gene_type:complete